jgi:hypothetical protein
MSVPTLKQILHTADGIKDKPMSTAHDLNEEFKKGFDAGAASRSEEISALKKSLDSIIEKHFRYINASGIGMCDCGDEVRTPKQWREHLRVLLSDTRRAE